MLDFFDEIVFAFAAGKVETELSERYFNSFGEVSSLKEEFKIPAELLSVYENISNGFTLTWQTDKTRMINGRMHFLEMQYVMMDQKGKLYEEEDLEFEERLAYFKGFDLISETHSVGFLHGTDYESKSLYLHNSPEPELYDLDLDFEGYMEMALEAKIFEYWPLVLLDIQTNSERPETTKFKKEMPKIFDGFDWDEFVEKYSSLRLSRQ